MRVLNLIIYLAIEITIISCMIMFLNGYLGDASILQRSIAHIQGAIIISVPYWIPSFHYKDNFMHFVFAGSIRLLSTIICAFAISVVFVSYFIINDNGLYDQYIISIIAGFSAFLMVLFRNAFID